ncbi:MAG: hypothetical protein QM755_07375 [Luteolibacter sp.]
MWKCANCGEEHEEQFDSCWKCSSRRNPNEPLDSGSDEEQSDLIRESWPDPVAVPSPDVFKYCQRCGLALEPFGSDHLRASTGLLGAFSTPEVAAWKCPRCKRVEFYADE